MKCPKCGYQSFNELATCKKCGQDLTEIQAKLNFGPPVATLVPPAGATAEDPLQSVRQAAASSPEAPSAEARGPRQEAEQGGEEHLLEDFFQSIDTAEKDQPTATAPSPPAHRPAAAVEKERVSASQVAADFAKWQQDTPQSDFPFDELDADLDVLRLSRSPGEPLTEREGPFDDVEAFDLNWSLPAEEQDFKERTPNSARQPTAPATAATDQWHQMELPSAAETPNEPVDRPGKALSAERNAGEEQWPLPEMPAPRQTDDDFSPAASAPESDGAAPGQEPTHVAREDGAQVVPAQIAAVFLPGAEQVPPATGALLLTRRAKAYLTDLGLLVTIFALFVFTGEIARLPVASERFHFTGDVLLDLAAPYFLVYFALCFGYFTFFHYLSGQTPGKMLFDIRVEGEEHAAITLAQAFLRCVGGLIALLPIGLGYLSIVLDGEQRGWNDRLAGCRVVMLETEESA